MTLTLPSHFRGPHEWPEATAATSLVPALCLPCRGCACHWGPVKEGRMGTALVVQWLGLHASNARGTGSISG